MGPTDPPPDSRWLIGEWTGSGWRRIREVVGDDERDRLLQEAVVSALGEAAAMRVGGRAGSGQSDVPPLCPSCRHQQVFWTSDNKDCPLCERRGRSGSWVICAACAEEAGVCVFDAGPLDGSSEDPVPWLAEVVAAAQRERAEAQFTRPRGTGRYSKPRDR